LNSKQRVLTVVGGKIPDRVPLCELIIDKKVIKSINPDWSYADIAEETVDMVLTNTPSLLYRKKILDSAKGIFINEWGIIRQESAQSVSMPLSGPIKSKEDLKDYKVPDPNDDFRYLILYWIGSRIVKL
jgi:uroporphyrinogen decarboxylase